MPESKPPVRNNSCAYDFSLRFQNHCVSFGEASQSSTLGLFPASRFSSRVLDIWGRMPEYQTQRFPQAKAAKAGGLRARIHPAKSRRAIARFRLLRMTGCANLDFCAVVRPERECVCAWLRNGFRFSGLVSAVGRAGVAQLVEHLICNQRVGGSNPFASSTIGASRNGTCGVRVDRRSAIGLLRRTCPPRRSH